MKPTAEFETHHDVEPPRVDERFFHPAWRVRTRVDKLLIDGAIGADVWRAASDYRVLYARAFGNLWRVPSLERKGSSQWRDPSTVTRIDALTALRVTRRQLGIRRTTLVEASVIADCSWPALGRTIGVSPKVARARTIAALVALQKILRPSGGVLC